MPVGAVVIADQSLLRGGVEVRNTISSPIIEPIA
jgi:hypothetical protein